jgi:perosamine synthetase
MLVQTKIPIAEPKLDRHDAEIVSTAILSGWISGRGKYVVNFEEELANWLGCKNVISCSTGTAALHLALASLRLTKTDEVIIPAFSMGAIPFAVAYTGANILLADSEMQSWNVDPQQIEQALTKNTRAIIAMHTYGHPVDLDPILKLCQARGVALIEDAAEAHGAEYKGKKVGTIGNIGCFSFFANKIITTGEGGAVATSDAKLAGMAKTLRDMAFSADLSKKFLHEFIGYNYRMTNMQAALGSSQLGRVEEFIKRRRQNARLYNDLLTGLPGITTPPEQTWAKNVYWMYSILVDEQFGLTRDELMIELSKKGIETRPFFVPVHEQPVFQKVCGNKKYPFAERLSRTGLNLPSGNTLTDQQVDYVASMIRSLKR